MPLQGDLFQDRAGRALEAADYSSFRELLLNSGCERCGLAAGRTRIVVDRGNPVASLMAIGEAPGEQEDLQGRAFVGRAGKLLDRLLAEGGLDAAGDLLIANVVKCRPPGNRAPRPEEAATCLPFLRRQIELLRPHTVLLLGAVAARHLFRERKPRPMKEQVGKIFSSREFPGVEFMVLYHPAYLLRDPRKQPAFVRCLGALRERLAGDGRWPDAVT